MCEGISILPTSFATGKYKGTILTAIGVDGNNQLLPVAFTFAESENIESWFWFLKLVKQHVVAGRPNMCLISDRHAGILQAIDRLQNGGGTSTQRWSSPSRRVGQLPQLLAEQKRRTSPRSLPWRSRKQRRYLLLEVEDGDRALGRCLASG